jgi:hypothetical protein
MEQGPICLEQSAWGSTESIIAKKPGRMMPDLMKKQGKRHHRMRMMPDLMMKEGETAP